MFTFRSGYLLIAFVLFLVEVCIALFVDDAFVRPYVGDFLVVILLYCFVKAFLDLPLLTIAVSVLVFAYCIEVLQYVRIVEVMGLYHSKLARVVLGTSFEWTDILAYTLGIGAVLLWENNRRIVSKESTNKR